MVDSNLNDPSANARAMNNHMETETKQETEVDIPQEEENK